jgi:hypothetical protein
MWTEDERVAKEETKEDQRQAREAYKRSRSAPDEEISLVPSRE